MEQQANALAVRRVREVGCDWICTDPARRLYGLLGATYMRNARQMGQGISLFQPYTYVYERFQSYLSYGRVSLRESCISPARASYVPN